MKLRQLFLSTCAEIALLTAETLSLVTISRYAAAQSISAGYQDGAGKNVPSYVILCPPTQAGSIGATFCTFGGSGGTVTVSGGSITLAPSSGASIGISPSAISGSSEVLKSSPGNLYGAYAVPTAAAYLMIFNATAAPSNGAVTVGTGSGDMQDCVPLQANQGGGISYVPGPPEVFSVGITAALSSTGCSTLTSTSGIIHGSVE